MTRRQLLLALAAGTLLGPVAHSQERVIRIVAKKFEFIPAEIRLERGVPVVLELTTEDVAMGFSLPDFKADVEIVPGKVARLRALDRRMLNEALAALPAHFREALILREMEDLPYKDIARITGAPIGTVMSRLARARRLLAASLQAIGKASTVKVAG